MVVAAAALVPRGCENCSEFGIAMTYGVGPAPADTDAFPPVRIDGVWLFLGVDVAGLGWTPPPETFAPTTDGAYDGYNDVVVGSSAAADALETEGALIISLGGLLPVCSTRQIERKIKKVADGTHQPSCEDIRRTRLGEIMLRSVSKCSARLVCL